MSQEPLIASYNLLILNDLMERHHNLSELVAAVAAYPQDVRREGQVVDGMQRFIANHSTFDALRESVNRELLKHGGIQYLREFSEQMDFNEFMAGD